MNEFRDEINKISKTVRGKYIDHKSIIYDDEINELILNPGSQEFISNASFKAKAEFLAYADHKNFTTLISHFKSEDIFDIVDSASIDQLRVILNKLISNESSQKPFFKNDFFGKINQLDDEKSFLINGYLKKISSNKNSKYRDGGNYFADFKNDFEKIKEENNSLKSSHEKIVNELILKIESLEKKNAEIIQERIDKNLSAYVERSVAALSEIEKKLKCAAARWSILSVFIIFSGFTAGIGFSLFGYAFGPELKYLKWPELLIFSIKGIFIVSAFVAAAGYSFIKSNAFTHEAIIVSNRAHAIQFGKLYLEIYGNTVERSEMQKIFENWNISSDTAFLKTKNDKPDAVKFSEFLDSLKKVKELIPSIGKE